MGGCIECLYCSQKIKGTHIRFPMQFTDLFCDYYGSRVKVFNPVGCFAFVDDNKSNPIIRGRERWGEYNVRIAGT